MKNLGAAGQYSNGCGLRVRLDLLWVNPKVKTRTNVDINKGHIWAQGKRSF